MESDVGEAEAGHGEVQPLQQQKGGRFPRPCWNVSALDDVRRALRGVPVVVGYYALGMWLFGLAEDWTASRSFYYLSITVSTVGYGDFYPETAGGRWLAVVFIPTGIVVVFVYIGRWAGLVHGRIVESAKWLFSSGPESLEQRYPIEEYSPAEVDARIVYSRRVLIAMSPVLVMFVVFTVLIKYRLDLSWSTAVYFAMVTGSTVGYGDVNFGGERAENKILASIWVLVFVVVFANCVQEVLLIEQRHNVRRGKIMVPTPDELEAHLLSKIGTTHTLAELEREPAFQEADYVVATLLDGGIVDEELVQAIRRTFYWTQRYDGEIVPEDVFAAKKRLIHLKKQQQQQQQQRHQASSPPPPPSSSSSSSSFFFFSSSSKNSSWALQQQQDEEDEDEKVLAMDLEDWLQNSWGPRAEAARQKHRLYLGAIADRAAAATVLEAAAQASPNDHAADHNNIVAGETVDPLGAGAP